MIGTIQGQARILFMVAEAFVVKEEAEADTEPIGSTASFRRRRTWATCDCSGMEREVSRRQGDQERENDAASCEFRSSNEAMFVQAVKYSTRVATVFLFLLLTNIARKQCLSTV